jgi:ketose-bisphosphate aldolase
MLVSMKEMLVKAQVGKYAVPHFNVWNVEMLEGARDAAEECSSPVILSFGTGFIKNTEIDHFASMMISMARDAKVPACVHWDHGRNFGIVQHAVDIGFTSVMIDASANPLDLNIRLTKEVVEAFQHRGIPVEAELGHVGAETKYEEALASYGYTDPDQAREFIEGTGADALAVAIGNMHGVYSSEPKIDFGILERVRNAVDVPLVLHGASGIGDADVRRAISLGCTKINIHTELGQAGMIAIVENCHGMNYLALQQEVRKAIKARAAEKIRLFGSEGKAFA